MPRRPPRPRAPTALGYTAQATPTSCSSPTAIRDSRPGAVSAACLGCRRTRCGSSSRRRRRSRLTVFFRLLLAIPHFVWLSLWRVLVALIVPSRGFSSLVTGPPAAALHRFIAAWVRYYAHVWRLLVVIGGPFPGFVGARAATRSTSRSTPRSGSGAGSRCSAASSRSRRSCSPARSALVVSVVGFLGWLAALVTGRMPRRASQPRRRRRPLSRADQRVRAPRSPTATRTPRPALRDRPTGPSSSSSGPSRRTPPDGDRGPAERCAPGRLVAAAALAWLACAALLLRTAVLRLPRPAGGRPDAVFGRGARPPRRSLRALLPVTWLLAQLVLCRDAVLYARHGPASRGSRRPGRIGTGMLLGMLGLAIVWLVAGAVPAARRSGGTAATTTPTAAISRRCSATGSSSAASSVHLLRAARRDGARPPACRRRGGFRRRRSSSGSRSSSLSSTRTSSRDDGARDPPCGGGDASTRGSRG